MAAKHVLSVIEGYAKYAKKKFATKLTKFGKLVIHNLRVLRAFVVKINIGAIESDKRYDAFSAACREVKGR